MHLIIEKDLQFSDSIPAGSTSRVRIRFEKSEDGSIYLNCSHAREWINLSQEESNVLAAFVGNKTPNACTP